MGKAKARSLDEVRECVARINRDPHAIRRLQRQLKEHQENVRTVAEYLKENPAVDSVSDASGLNYCYAIRRKQTRFNPRLAREKLGPATAECYEEQTIVSVGFGSERDEEELNS